MLAGTLECAKLTIESQHEYNLERYRHTFIGAKLPYACEGGMPMDG